MICFEKNKLDIIALGCGYDWLNVESVDSIAEGGYAEVFKRGVLIN